MKKKKKKIKNYLGVYLVVEGQMGNSSAVCEKILNFL